MENPRHNVPKRLPRDFLAISLYHFIVRIVIPSSLIEGAQRDGVYRIRSFCRGVIGICGVEIVNLVRFILDNFYPFTTISTG